MESLPGESTEPRLGASPAAGDTSGAGAHPTPSGVSAAYLQLMLDELHRQFDAVAARQADAALELMRDAVSHEVEYLLEPVRVALQREVDEALASLRRDVHAAAQAAVAPAQTILVRQVEDALTKTLLGPASLQRDIELSGEVPSPARDWRDHGVQSPIPSPLEPAQDGRRAHDHLEPMQSSSSQVPSPEPLSTALSDEPEDARSVTSEAARFPQHTSSVRSSVVSTPHPRGKRLSTIRSSIRSSVTQIGSYSRDQMMNSLMRRAKPKGRGDATS